eukprot:m.338839 g.338839  ORF g.338839 m.338839 type:complete len:259 (-) comp16087_c0_seq2:353-1129(-)
MGIYLPSDTFLNQLSVCYVYVCRRFMRVSGKCLFHDFLCLDNEINLLVCDTSQLTCPHGVVHVTCTSQRRNQGAPAHKNYICNSPLSVGQGEIMAAEVAKVANRLQEAKQTCQLDLSDCQLTKVPAAVFFVLKPFRPTITHLDLSHNQLKKVPAKLATFSGAHDVSFDNNMGITLPLEMETMPLLVVSMKSCGLESIPPALFGIETLETINLQDNGISEVSGESTRRWPSLRQLNMQGNPLSASSILSLQTRPFSLEY